MSRKSFSLHLVLMMLCIGAGLSISERQYLLVCGTQTRDVGNIEKSHFYGKAFRDKHRNPTENNQKKLYSTNNACF